MADSQQRQGDDLFVVDNSDSDWKVRDYAIAHMRVPLKLKETGFTAWSDLTEKNRVNIYLTNALEPATDDKKQREFPLITWSIDLIPLEFIDRPISARGKTITTSSFRIESSAGDPACTGRHAGESPALRPQEAPVWDNGVALGITRRLFGNAIL